MTPHWRYKGITSGSGLINYEGKQKIRSPPGSAEVEYIYMMQSRSRRMGASYEGEGTWYNRSSVNPYE